MPCPRIDLALLQTAVTNGVTAAVAVALARNRALNPEIEPGGWPAGRQAPYVEVIVPARNEERNIEAVLGSLLGQRYPEARWGITVVNDGSSDRTGEMARGLAARSGGVRFQVVDAPPLPSGWTGKNHAMWTGHLAARPEAEWLLFVDADTRHDPHALASITLRAAESGAALLSLVIRIQMQSFWERLLVPQVGELYTLLVGTMDQVNSSGEQAAANGQTMIVRRDAYRLAGALPEVRSDVAEDRALAVALKARGCTVRLEYGQKLVRSRVYSSLRELWEGYSKTLFWATGRGAPRALSVVAALSFYGLGPWMTAARSLIAETRRERSKLALHFAAQTVPMLALRVAVCRRMGIPPWYSLMYPASVAMGNAMLLNSMLRVLSGRGVQWKGRQYRA